MSSALEAVVMGASAGAVDALLQLLPALPAAYPLPIVIVVHLPPDKQSVLAELFQAKCSVTVREVEDKEPLEGGTVYIAPPNYHVLVEQNRTLSLSNEEAVHYSRPSIDVLFESAADAYGAGMLGILLTGANDDGASGLKVIALAGGTVAVQRPDTAAHPTMPQAGLKKCPNALALSLSELAAMLQKVAYAEFAE